MSNPMPNSEKAYEMLERLWEEIRKIPETELMRKSYLKDKELRHAIKRIIRGKTKSYRYAIITQVLAKIVDPAINCLALQLKSELPGSFDARSFCRKVLVRFERNRLGYILGGSDDPYVSKPLRHDEVSLKYLEEIRDKDGWRDLYAFLNSVEKMEKMERVDVLREILLEIYKYMFEVEKAYLGIKQDLNKKKKIRIDTLTLIDVIDEFLSHPSGGARPQIVAYSLITIFNERTNVFNNIATSRATVANEFARRLADIECKDASGNVKLAVAVTETLTQEKFREEVNKAIRRKINRLLLLAHKIQQINQLVEVYMQKYRLNITVLSIKDFTALLTTLLNNQLCLEVVNKISENLKRFEYPKHLLAWEKILRKKGILIT